jgi:thymidylate synthase
MTINIIVAFSTKNFGIGYENKIPWNIPNDLVYFSKITKNSIVIMGYNTWKSLPMKPLKNRLNVIITSQKINIKEGIVVHPDDLDDYLKSISTEVFIIGGEMLYKKYVGIADYIYSTHILKEFICDRFFPIDNFHQYEISEYSESFDSEDEKCNYRFVKYQKTNKLHGENVYLDHMRNILENGDVRDDRTGTGTKSIFGGQLRFDISKSIPILTTKFVPFQLTIKELLFFLRGETDSKILERQGVNIWAKNTNREFLDKRGLVNYREGDMGSLYGFVLTSIGAEYKGCHVDYTGQGINQLEKLVKGLKEDPFSRRHLTTTFCPLYVEQGVLYPCHSIISQFYVIEKNKQKYLSSHVYNRSADWFLGFPINILSHSILTYIIAKKCGYLPYELIISIGDGHIYNNLIEQSKIQLERHMLPFPKLILNDNIINKDFKDIELSDFEMIGYLSNPKITGDMAV